MSHHRDRCPPERWEKRKELGARLYAEYVQLPIYGRDRFTDYVFDYCARLEAEKQAAHTEGWNAAIHDAADLCEFHAKVASSPSDRGLLTGLASVITHKAKPTAAKPEPSPSSANRAEGRQG